MREILSTQAYITANIVVEKHAMARLYFMNGS